MRIVFVIGNLAQGGTETQLLNLIRGLRDSEFEPQLFALEAKGPLLKIAQKENIPVFDGGYRGNASKILKLLLLGSAFFRLVHHLYRSRASIIHGFLPLNNLLSCLAGKLARVELIITSRRALNFHQDRVRGWLFFDQLTCLLSDIITVNSNAVREDTLMRERVDTKKIIVVYNGIDANIYAQAAHHRSRVRRSFGFDSTNIVIIIVANLIPYKGHDELLDAIQVLTKLNANIRLLVVGEDRGICKSLVNKCHHLSIDQYVHWLGLREDIPELLAASDIYVSASHEEGFSNSVLEAMASSKPIVATEVGGNAEMLEGGLLGLLVPTRNAVALAEAINKIVTDKELRSELGLMASAVATEKYSMRAMLNHHLSIYNSGLERLRRKKRK